MSPTRSQVPFAFVDVFAERPLAGAPLSLVTDADGLNESQMKAIAREFNQSETTFILPPSMPGATYRLRSFTPIGVEVGGAGHNALGAWLWLAASGRLDAGRNFAQEIGGAVLPVEIGRRDEHSFEVTMDQSPPVFGAIFSDGAELAASLGLDEVDLIAGKAQVVSTGAAHLLVQARDRKTVDRAAPDPPRLKAALLRAGGEGCYLYCRETRDRAATAYARFFNPTVGIWEDPATGTAAGPLAALLVESGEVAAGSTVVIEQGHAMGRPSRINIVIRGEVVRLSGSGVIVANGTIAVS